MADDFLTISDLVADKLGLADNEVSDLRRQAPLVALLNALESSNGTTHSYSKETGAPVVGFRAENTGRDLKHSTDTQVDVTLKILDFSWLVDKAVADKRTGAKGGKERVIAREGVRHIASAAFAYESQIFYGTGTGGDSGGFSGLAQASTLSAYNSSMVYNAAGTTASTGSSVWGIRVGENDMSGVYNGDLPFSLGDTTVIDAQDGTGKHFPAYYTPGCTWLGIQIGSIYSVGRIINLTEDSGKGLTDIKLANLLGKFPANRLPTHWVMNTRSLMQLQASRTATTPTGSPAPIPAEAFNIPIVVTDAILSTEAISA
jgi:hypothetical protein